jgi:Tfp pilus assembly protein PilF
MSDLRQILDQRLRQGDTDLIDVMDIVPIPMHGDRMVRLRSLEEALEDFSAENGATSYLIQIKTRAPAPAPSATDLPAAPHRPSAATASPVTGDNIYQGDGKLNIPYLTRNAELLLDAQEYALARNVYQAIAASGERKGLALFGIGRCDEAEDKLDSARTHYEESIAYHPTLESYHRLSAVLTAQKKEGLAAEALSRALASIKNLDSKTCFELHKACGNLYMRGRHPEASEKHYRQALELEPAADEIRANLGALYLQSHKADDARRVFEDSLASNPSNSRALSGLGSCHLILGDKRRAHDLFARSLEIELNQPTAVYQLVKCAYELKTYATAARLAEEYVQVAPINASLMYSLAGLQYHLGRKNDARGTAEQVLAMQNEHPGARELIKLIERSGP